MGNTSHKGDRKQVTVCSTHLFSLAGVVVMVGGACGSQSPQPVAASGCRTDVDCVGSEAFCFNGTCVSCRDDLDCVADKEKCQGGICVALTDEKAVRGSAMPANCQYDKKGNVMFGAVRFEFDTDKLNEDTRDLLEKQASCLAALAEIEIFLEGHCDERGTQEYNLGLGEQRARAVKAYLKNLGIEGVRLHAVSKGKNQPLCRRPNERCYARNRRVELVPHTNRSDRSTAGGR